MFPRVFCLLVLCFVHFSALAVDQTICDLILKNGGIPQPAELTKSTAERLQLVLSRMEAGKRQELYTALKDKNLSALAGDIKSERLSKEKLSLLAAHPGLDIILLDLAEFGDAIPGVFAAPNTDALVMKFLGKIRQQELESKVQNQDLLKTQAVAARLRRTLENTLINLIEQANMEYQGAKFGRTFWNRRLRGLGRWFFPSYNKVSDIVDFGRAFEFALLRLQMVDRLIVNSVSDAANAHLSDAAFSKLVAQILHGPEEVQAMLAILKKDISPEMDLDKVGEIGKFDIEADARKVRSTNLDKIINGFDSENIAGLDMRNDALNEARKVQGQAARSEKDYDRIELQLYAEAFNRRIGYYVGLYGSAMQTSSKETYEIERSHQEWVKTGSHKDSNGNEVEDGYYKTVWEWVSHTASMEEVLSGSFETGERNTDGLDKVKERTSTVRAREKGPRALVKSSEAVVEKFLAVYSDMVLYNKTKDGKLTRDQLEKQVVERIEALDKAIPEQGKYSNLKDSEMLAQYVNELDANFHLRNNAILQRMIGAQRLLKALMELMRRGQPNIEPTFDAFEYEKWLSTLKHYRNRNYLIKTGLGALVAAGIASYVELPEFQTWVDTNIQQLSDWVSTLVHGETPAPRYRSWR